MVIDVIVRDRRGGMRPEWRAHIDEMMDRYRQMRDDLGDAQQRIAELTATIESEDKMVTVTVDHRGDLVALELHPRAYRILDREALAEAIVDITQQATRDVRAQAKEIMQPLLPVGVAGADFADPTGGDLMTVLPRDPTDPTRLGGFPR